MTDLKDTEKIRDGPKLPNSNLDCEPSIFSVCISGFSLSNCPKYRELLQLAAMGSDSEFKPHFVVISSSIQVRSFSCLWPQSKASSYRVYDDPLFC